MAGAVCRALTAPRPWSPSWATPTMQCSCCAAAAWTTAERHMLLLPCGRAGGQPVGAPCRSRRRCRYSSKPLHPKPPTKSGAGAPGLVKGRGQPPRAAAL
eukprot:5931092-Heterocapsa_arctica.AAC.1